MTKDRHSHAIALVAGTVTAAAMLLSTAARAGADLAIDVFDQPDPVTLGNDVTYTVTVRNYGPDGRDAYVEARMPFEPSTITVPEIACMQPVRECGGYFVYSCFTRIACAVGWLDRGAVRSLDIKVHPTEASGYERSFFETDHYYDPDSSNNTAEEVTVVRKPGAPVEEDGGGGGGGSCGPALLLLAAVGAARRRKVVCGATAGPSRRCPAPARSALRAAGFVRSRRFH